MRNIVNKATRKLKVKAESLGCAARLLLSSCSECDAEDALSYLEAFSPDRGKSCWRHRGPEYAQRSCALSVIVPAYNVETYIVNCLESILSQEVSFPYEVIVINDGSTDATASILENYRENENVHILSQPNAGLSAARNKGIDCAKGEYLCFVDSDDDLPAGALEALMTPALREQAALVVGSYAKYTRDGTLRYIGGLRDQKVENLKLPGFAHGRVVHYSVFQNLQFPEGYWFEDSVMAQIIHPMCRNSTYTVSPVCYHYYDNDTGITATAKGRSKSVDSLWITKRLLEERKRFHLPFNQENYAYFLSVVNLTYHRTKYLGVRTSQCIFTVQRKLLEQYYSGCSIADDRKKISDSAGTSHQQFQTICDGL